MKTVHSKSPKNYFSHIFSTLYCKYLVNRTYWNEEVKLGRNFKRAENNDLGSLLQFCTLNSNLMVRVQSFVILYIIYKHEYTCFYPHLKFTLSYIFYSTGAFSELIFLHTVIVASYIWAYVDIGSWQYVVSLFYYSIKMNPFRRAYAMTCSQLNYIETWSSISLKWYNNGP